MINKPETAVNTPVQTTFPTIPSLEKNIPEEAVVEDEFDNSFGSYLFYNGPQLHEVVYGSLKRLSVSLSSPRNSVGSENADNFPDSRESRLEKNIIRSPRSVKVRGNSVSNTNSKNKVTNSSGSETATEHSPVRKVQRRFSNVYAIGMLLYFSTKLNLSSDQNKFVINNKTRLFSRYEGGYDFANETRQEITAIVLENRYKD
ncbi:hypothetical protein HK099_004769 [Clydaea vesicula]|uniref:Uncharacterized protein n=1 Tax=Clydaea vesicula TaxID=447962 RepID=A0AAD5XZE1_9FUNG|nr:hypothetical protein HK099_004769 [Clydaea vesicula]